jgi:tetratricopeptide (TPR) repeat protein
MQSYICLGDISSASRTNSEIINCVDSKDASDFKQQTAVLAKEKGNFYFKSGNVDTAIEYYTLAIDLDPDNFLLYSNRSACQQLKMNWDSAISDAKTVIDLNKSFPKGYIHLARSQLQQKLYEDARATIQSAVATLQESADWVTLKSQFDELNSDLTKRIAAANAHTAAQVAEARAKAEELKTKGTQDYQRGSYQDAIRFYSQAIAVFPSEGLYYGNRAASWIMLKEFSRAISDCDLGLAHEASLGDYNKLRARKITALTNLGRLDDAIAIASEVKHKTRTQAFDDQLKSLELLKSNIDLAQKSLENKEYRLVK